MCKKFKKAVVIAKCVLVEGVRQFSLYNLVTNQYLSREYATTITLAMIPEEFRADIGMLVPIDMATRFELQELLKYFHVVDMDLLCWSVCGESYTKSASRATQLVANYLKSGIFSASNFGCPSAKRSWAVAEADPQPSTSRALSQQLKKHKCSLEQVGGDGLSELADTPQPAAEPQQSAHIAEYENFVAAVALQQEFYNAVNSPQVEKLIHIHDPMMSQGSNCSISPLSGFATEYSLSSGLTPGCMDQYLGQEDWTPACYQMESIQTPQYMQNSQWQVNEAQDFSDLITIGPPRIQPELIDLTLSDGETETEQPEQAVYEDISDAEEGNLIIDEEIPTTAIVADIGPQTELELCANGEVRVSEMRGEQETENEAVSENLETIEDTQAEI